MEALLHDVLRIAQDLLRAEEASTPQPRVAPAVMRERLDLSLGSQGLDRPAMVSLLEQVVTASPRTSDPRFVNQLFAGRLPEATAAEMLTALLNLSLYTYKAAGPHVLLEGEVVRHMCQFAGFPDGDGIPVPGGSMANLVGMMLGRQQAVPGIREQGADGRKHCFYLSEDGHYSVVKNAGIMGVGREQVRRIACDDLGRMSSAALQEVLRADLAAGHVPCAVIATAGTTVLGAFDPLDELADICEEHGLWLHVDGAFGASLLLHPPSRHLMRGLDRADSLTWDAHKAMGIPLAASLILTRQPEQLAGLLNEDADYLFQADDPDLNPGTRSMQCGRRNDAFKLWAAWKALGDEGWAQRFERQFALTRHARSRVLAEPRLELTQEPASLTVCFEVEGVSSSWLCQRVHEEGLAVLGYGIVRGREVLRLVTVNPDTTPKQLDTLFDDLLRLATSPQAVAAS